MIKPEGDASCISLRFFSKGACIIQEASLLSDARINIDPNGAWSLDEAVRLCKNRHSVLTYVEDPCGPEAGDSSREIMREFKNATQFQVATNMIATDWRQFCRTVSLNACSIILADPHFWGFDGAVRMSRLLHSWGLTWGAEEEFV